VNISTDAGRCWVFFVERSILDTAFHIKTFDGEPSEWYVYQAHPSSDKVVI